MGMRLDTELADLEASVQEADRLTARIHLAAFELELGRYVSAEERVVVPALSQHARTAAKMRAEHGRLRELVAAIRVALQSADLPRISDLVAALRSVWVLHVTKEEWVFERLLVR